MGTHPIFESDFDCLTEKMIFVGVKRIRLSSNDGNTHTIFISTKECNDIHPTIIKKLESLIQKSDQNPESDNWDLEEQTFGNERPWWEEFFNVLSGNLISLDPAQAVKIKQAADFFEMEELSKDLKTYISSRNDFDSDTMTENSEDSNSTSRFPNYDISPEKIKHLRSSEI